MLHAGMVLHSRYEIIKTIGKGGMSTVYLARDLNNKRLLAIKDVERTGISNDQVVEQSLVGEGKMLKLLMNPHLPRIYDIIENPENIMLVMDYIEGESLDKIIAREGPQSQERVLNWGMQICEVFHYLHNLPTPVIYRDMKPANVMLKPDGTVMMIDFGTARTQKVGVEMRADTICIGTAGFAAPEQFGGIGQSDARTDIFCLGGTLYNMVTGHSPSEKPVGIQPLERWDPALAGTPIAEIIYKCTRNDPNERYQTALELYEDLYLASAGGYRTSSSKGKSGGLKKGEWQKQNVQGNGILSGGLTGLTGLTQWAKTDKTPANPQVSSFAPAQPRKLQEQPPVGQSVRVEKTETVQQSAPQPVHVSGQADLWRKLMLIGALVALIFVILAVVLVVLDQMGAAIVFMMIALAAAVLAALGVIQYRRLS